MQKKSIVPGVLLLLILLTACNTHPTQKGQMNNNNNMELRTSQIDGDIFLYSITNKNGITVEITNYGGIIQSLIVPDKKGNPGDIVLGFDSVKRYTGEHPYFGAIVGRYANRIREGRFKIGEEEYQLTINNGRHHLHGGISGLDRVTWDAEPIEASDSAGIRLSYSSPAGDQGYPGRLDITVTYILNNRDELRMDYQAVTTEPTPVNITNHSYFNLAAEPGKDILDHILLIDADRYTVVDQELIPTGELRDVTGTPFDFRKPQAIGSRIGETDGGYDHNFALNDTGSMRKVIEVTEPLSGRKMEILTSEPGVQFYTGNFLDGTIKGKDGVFYSKHAGFCLETQHFPDSPNQPGFPGVILQPGETYHQTTIYKFTTGP